MDSSGTAPIIELPELNEHLDKLVQDPALPLKPELLGAVERQLTNHNVPPLIPQYLPRIVAILQTYTLDPAPLASLATRLLGPLSFTDVMKIATDDSLIDALRSPAPSLNILTMTILEKAAKSTSHITILAAMKDVVSEFLTRWLAAPQVEVGEKGVKVLGDLLDVDCTLAQPTLTDDQREQLEAQQGIRLVTRKYIVGQGMLWRRIFRDTATYAIIENHVREGRLSESQLSAHQRSLAQARLLRVLPRLAILDLNAVATTVLEGVSTPLLQMAALQMVDRSDILMNLNLQDFFETLVCALRVAKYDSYNKDVYKVDILKQLLRPACAVDAGLKAQLWTLPTRGDKVDPEEEGAMREWLAKVVPAGSGTTIVS